MWCHFFLNRAGKLIPSLTECFFQNVGITASCMNSENTCEKWMIPTIKQPLQTTKNSKCNNDYVNNVKMVHSRSVQFKQCPLWPTVCVSSKVPASVGWACLEVALWVLGLLPQVPRLSVVIWPLSHLHWFYIKRALSLTKKKSVQD